MKQGFTFIAVVLDKSSSMESVRQETIDGFNEFIQTQRSQPGDAVLTLVQFASDVEVTYDAKPIAQVESLTPLTYAPHGMTALNDAIGLTIDRVGARLRAMPEGERPAQVIVCVMTDGGENSSHEFSRAKVAGMVKHQREKYSWDFVFIGANQDAVLSAQSLGIDATNALNYSGDAQGTAKAFHNLSVGVSNYRTVGAAGVTRNFFNPKSGG